MGKSSKRRISGLLAFVMIVSLMMTNVTGVNLFAEETRKIEVWDFGGVVQSGDIYNNNISLDKLNSMTEFPAGKWATTGTYDFNGLLLNANGSDRMYNAGTNNYGSNAKANVDFGDGYVSNGMYYANGTGGDNRRNVIVNNTVAGDKITVYAGTSNSTDTNTHFVYMGADGTQDDVQVLPAASGKLEFIAKYSGQYKVYFETTGGKPVINRVMQTPSVTVSGSVDVTGLEGLGTYGIMFTNQTTNDQITATVTGNDFTVLLTPGFSYIATMTGAQGFGMTNESKTVTVDVSSVATGTMTGVALKAETKAIYTATGSIKGFASDYSKVTDLSIKLLAPENTLFEDVTPVLDLENMTYSATLEPDVEYTVELSGVNDYEVVAGGTFYDNQNLTQDIEVATKATYSVSGSLVELEGAFAGTATAVKFTNVEDGYTYAGTIDGGKYSADLRDGAYGAEVTADGYKTSTHVVVNGKAVSKDLLMVSTDTTITPIPLEKDIYVNPADSSAYATVKEAVAAAKAMNPQSEADRITVHIAPGTYREQIIVDTPYLTFVNDSDKEEVILTWYYGIGYQYYSVDSTGYFNDENAFDKYEKNSASKWGVGTYIKSAATAFRADNITFEASFNKYVTDEELADGVVTGGADAKNFERKLTSDVASRASQERSSALAIEADNSEFVNCKMIGSQDTLYTGTNVNIYIKNCVIEGSTDFMFGDGDVVFDGCEIKWCGYTDTATGGHLTAVKDTAAYGYLFRNCTVTTRKTAYADDKVQMKQTAGNFGRPWGAGAKVTFMNTKLESIDMITAVGWVDMNGNLPQNANFREYNTISLDGKTVDTSKRVEGTVITDASGINVANYFGDWTPVNYVAEDSSVAISGDVSVKDNGDINLPKPGHTLTAYYSLGANNDANDATVVDWYRVSQDGTNTLIKSTNAVIGNEYKLTAADTGSYIKIVVNPETISGNKGNAVEYLVAAVVGDGYEDPVTGDVTVGDGINVFLAGDSTVKDYSAGAINNATTRVEGSWGEYLGDFLNNKYVTVYNYANGGRSSQSFIEEGSLAKIDEKMKEGDYLFVQFGHNDCAYGTADRYVPVGEPDGNGVYPTTEGTFKYYLKQYIDTAKAKGAIPVLCTPVSRMYFNSDGTIKTHHDDDKSSNNAYVTAVLQLASEENVAVFDTFEMTKNMYEKTYKDDPSAANGVSVAANRLFAPNEKTHHSKLGGFVIAGELAKMIQSSELGINKYVVAPTRVLGEDHEGKYEFTVSAGGVFTGYDKDADDNYSIVDTYWTDWANQIISVIETGEVPTETTTETSTETTTETGTETTTETTTQEIPSGSDDIFIKPVVDGQSKLDASSIGQKVVVDYNISSNDNLGFNNYTLFITYDPAVVQPVGGITAADTSKYVKNADELCFEENVLTNQVNLVPVAGDSDYADVNADGVKTAGELGKVKYSWYCKTNDTENNLMAIKGDGTLFSMEFEIVGKGDADLDIAVIGNGFYTNATEQANGNKFVVITDKGDLIIEDGLAVVYGDADGDGVLTGSDAAWVMNKVLNSSIVLPIEQSSQSANYYLIVCDVDGDGVLTGTDAAYIMQKVLNGSFELPVEKAS